MLNLKIEKVTVRGYFLKKEIKTFHQKYALVSPYTKKAEGEELDPQTIQKKFRQMRVGITAHCSIPGVEEDFYLSLRIHELDKIVALPSNLTVEMQKEMEFPGRAVLPSAANFLMEEVILKRTNPGPVGIYLDKIVDDDLELEAKNIRMSFALFKLELEGVQGMHTKALEKRKHIVSLMLEESAGRKELIKYGLALPQRKAPKGKAKLKELVFWIDFIFPKLLKKAATQQHPALMQTHLAIKEKAKSLGKGEKLEEIIKKVLSEIPEPLPFLQKEQIALLNKYLALNSKYPNLFSATIELFPLFYDSRFNPKSEKDADLFTLDVATDFDDFLLNQREKNRSAPPNKFQFSEDACPIFEELVAIYDLLNPYFEIAACDDHGHIIPETEHIELLNLLQEPLKKLMPSFINDRPSDIPPKKWKKEILPLYCLNQFYISTAEYAQFWSFVKQFPSSPAITCLETLLEKGPYAILGTEWYKNWKAESVED